MKIGAMVAVVVLSACASRVDSLSVCQSVTIAVDSAKSDVIISGLFRTDGMHSSTISDAACPAQEIIPLLRRSAKSGEINVKRGDEFLEKVFSDSIAHKLTSYHIVARGTLFPVDKYSGERNFEIVEVIELEKIDE